MSKFLMQFFDRTDKKAKTVSKENPMPVELVTNDSGGGTQSVNVQNFPTWQGVGYILAGTVAQGEEKLIAVDGATAIWIQADAANTSPLLVSNIQGFEGVSVQPGSSEWFYYPTIACNCY